MNSQKFRENLDKLWQNHLSPRKADAPTVISTFSGCGGSSLGFSARGYHELLAVERNDVAAKTFRVNFPGVPVYEDDITTLTVDNCLTLAGLSRGELDVLDGSPPCQGFSIAGNSIYSDPRNQLFFQFARLLRGLQPKLFVAENVKGMIKGKMRLLFTQILKELKSCGYTIIVKVMPMCYFGVPQLRERVIFFGIRNDLASNYNLTPSLPVGKTKPISVWQAIGDLGDTQIPENKHVWPSEKISVTLKKASLSRPEDSFGHATYHSSWHRPAHTLMTGMSRPSLFSLGRHPKYVRSFSVLEYMLLSSFPPQFQLCGEMSDHYRMFGNCVPPVFMAEIAEHMGVILTKLRG